MTVWHCHELLREFYGAAVKAHGPAMKAHGEITAAVMPRVMAIPLRLPRHTP